jgi:hypothetical protein
VDFKCPLLNPDINLQIEINPNIGLQFRVFWAYNNFSSFFPVSFPADEPDRELAYCSSCADERYCKYQWVHAEVDVFEFYLSGHNTTGTRS